MNFSDNWTTCDECGQMFPLHLAFCSRLDDIPVRIVFTPGAHIRQALRLAGIRKVGNLVRHKVEWLPTAAEWLQIRGDTVYLYDPNENTTLWNLSHFIIVGPEHGMEWLTSD
jgi:hypothetical protein